MNYQPEHLIKQEAIEGEIYDVCAVCDQILEPIYENVGFSEPGAEHTEFAGYRVCTHQEN